MPLFKTKMMPASAARSSTRGLPPLGLGGSSGNNGSMVFHSSSDTSSLAITFPYPHQQVLKGSLSRGETPGESHHRTCCSWDTWHSSLGDEVWSMAGTRASAPYHAVQRILIQH